MVDPNKRYKIQDIRQHPWFNLVEHIPRTGIIIGKSEIQVNEEIFNKVCQEYNISPEQLRYQIRHNKFSSSTTIYYMILKRIERANKAKLKWGDTQTSKKKSIMSTQ